jgi:hypothetical protein
MILYKFLKEMKGYKFSVIAVAFLCVVFSGCQRDKGSEVFTAVMQSYNNSGKDYIVGNVVYWSDADRIRINDGVYGIAVDGSDSNRATVNAEGVSDFGGNYYGAYPAEGATIAANGRVTFTIPQQELYATAGGKQVIHNIMAAKSNGSKLNFQNLCALLHFKVAASGSGVGAKLYAVEVVTDKPMWGTMTADYNESLSKWEVSSMTASDANTRTLRLKTPVELTAAEQDLYLLVPPVAGGSTLTLRFILENGTGAVKVFEKAKSTSFSFESGMIYHFNQSNTFNGTAMLYGSDAVTAETMDGSVAHPYLVYSGNSWNVLKTDSIMGAAGKQINLAEDINVSSTYTSVFRATLNGNGHTITLTTPNISLLSSIERGQVRSVTIKSTEPVRHPKFKVDGASRLFGALAGQAFSNAVFENCINKVDISCDTSLTTVYIGGLIGKAEGSTITNCRNEGNIITNAMYVGGVVGQTESISDCVNSGTITISSSSDVVVTNYCGGVAGYVSVSAVSNCHNVGSININKNSSVASSYYGGVFGLANSNVSNCSNTGIITNSAVSNGTYKYIGGIVGGNTISVGTMLNCYNEGDVLCSVSTSNMYVGGLLGYDKRMSIKNSYAFCSLQGSYVCGIVAFGEQLKIDAYITNCYYYGTITCGSSFKFGIAGESNNDNKFIIDKCYYPSGDTICHLSSTNNGTSATLSSAVSLTGGDGTSLCDALNGVVLNNQVPGACNWKNSTSPARVVFDN